MRLSLLLLMFGCLAMILATACRPRSNLRRHENHLVYRIPKTDIGIGKKEKSEGEGGKSQKEDSTTRVHRSVWLAREIWETYRKGRQERRRLTSIEVLFCPGDKADFTQCRVGVAFSLKKERMGMRIESN